MNIRAILSESPKRRGLLHHPFFEEIRRRPLSRAQAKPAFQEWWHPMQHFTIFLPELMAKDPSLERRSYVSRIHYQELGSGNPSLSHERLFLRDLSKAGYPSEEIIDHPMLPATQILMRSYRESTRNLIDGMGALAGTEFVDLGMVESMGEIILKIHPESELIWVNAHRTGEALDVASVVDAVGTSFDTKELDSIIRRAEQTMGEWSALFDNLRIEIFGA